MAAFSKAWRWSSWSTVSNRQHDFHSTKLSSDSEHFKGVCSDVCRRHAPKLNHTESIEMITVSVNIYAELLNKKSYSGVQILRLLIFLLVKYTNIVGIRQLNVTFLQFQNANSQICSSRLMIRTKLGIVSQRFIRFHQFLEEFWCHRTQSNTKKYNPQYIWQNILLHRSLCLNPPETSLLWSMK